MPRPKDSAPKVPSCFTGNMLTGLGELVRELVQTYWPAALSILLATLTPLNPFTYLAMPR